jgi:ATP-dependent DNA helicase RecG
LKELGLTEGRGTGFPTIYKAMADNGSPDPIFDTDKDFTCFLTTLPAHLVIANQESNQESNGAVQSTKTLFDFESVEFILKETGTKLGLSLDQVGTKLAPSRHQVSTKLAPSWHQVKLLLDYSQQQHTIKEMKDFMLWSDRTKFRMKYITPLLEIEILKMTNPTSPNAPNQQYFLSKKGTGLLNYLKNVESDELIE